ncbi:MAG TPA: SGNH/GDSL hydrolase family protein [Gammaproteobacteria bacterium]|nr:SGNH/GDSL hydrolase family protein [Gammaproteobacteria bacterium]
MKLVEVRKRLGHFLRSLLMVLISISLCLLIVEVSLRFYFERNISFDIEMSRYTNLGKKASSNPRIGHIHKSNISERLMGVQVETNSDGLRDREYPVERTDSYRIIFLGDSLTFGWGAKREETFEYLLEERLSKTHNAEILNFGIGNYNTVQQVNLFREKGLKYKPDQVSMFFFINDAELLKKPSSLEFLSQSQLVTFYWSRLRGLFTNNSSESGYLDYYTQLYLDSSQGWQEARTALLQMKKLALENDIAFQVILLPELHELVNYPFKDIYDLVESFLKENDIDVLNTTPAFKNEVEPMKLWVARDDAHPNARAHRIIANSSIEFIARRIGE